MAISFEGYLNLAEMARQDNSLIKNHIESGVLTWIEARLNDIPALADVAKIMGDQEYLERIKLEEKQLKNALSVYNK